MCTPVGHSIAALIVKKASSRDGGTSQNAWAYFLFCLFSGIAADMDFLVGWFFGDINRFHHHASHSISMAALYGVAVYVFFDRWSNSLSSGLGIIMPLSPKKLAFVGSGIYLSHLVLDLLTIDEFAPIGMLLWWPFSGDFVLSPFTPFQSVEHHGSGGDMLFFLSGVLVKHNLFTVLVELGILLPFYGVCSYLKSSERMRRALKNNP